MRRLLLTVSLLVLVLGPASPAPASQPVLRILAVGDFGVGGEPELAIGQAIQRFEARYPARLLVTLGDNDYTGDPAAFSANWQAAFGWLEAAAVDVAGSLGNHDVAFEGGGYELEALQMPSRYYTRRLGDGLVELFVLDSTSPGLVQTRWLRTALHRSRARWKLVAFHHPAYTCGEYRGHDGVLARWVPLLDRYGVDLVLSGHDHNYQRFAPRRGVTHVVDGGGGGERLYPIERCPAGYPQRLRAFARYGFLSLRITHESIEGRAVNRAGTTLDRFWILR